MTRARAASTAPSNAAVVSRINATRRGLGIDRLSSVVRPVEPGVILAPEPS